MGVPNQVPSVPSVGVAQTDAPAFTIGQLAQEFGLTIRALRFYEARGFLAPRRQGSARLYGPSDRDRIGLILHAKRLGFTLREIAELMAAQGETDLRSLHLNRRQCTDQI